jgi:hypothetical protein
VTTRRALLSTVRGRAAVAVSALALATGLGACQMMSPITTQLQYDPADGVSVDLEDVVVRDLLIVSEGEGASGVLSGLVVNKGTEEVTLTIQTDTSGGPLEPEVTVAPGTSVRLDGIDPLTGEKGEPVTVPEVTTAPGTYVTVRFSTSTGAADAVQAPVLAPTGPYGELAETTG